MDSDSRWRSELQALQRRLNHAERFAALGALAATLAHELGTPLHSVAGHLALLRDDPALPPRLRERTEIVAGEVDRLCQLIRRHLERLRSPLPEPVPTDVNGLVQRIARVVGPLLETRGVALELDLADDAAAPFACDGGQVEQVLMNLVQNAVDAMPDGGTLTVRTLASPESRAISVCDTGVGVSPEVMERVFDPFVTTKEARGTGLGLGLCREIARNHGGDIVLDSQADTGTVVTLTLGPHPRAKETT